MKLQESVEYFLTEQELRGNTQKTVRGYKLFLGIFVEYLSTQGIDEVESVSLVSVNKFHMHLRNKERKLKPTTIHTYLRHVRAFLNFLYQEDIVKTDIGNKMTLPKTGKQTIEILTNDEIARLLECNSSRSELGRRNRAIIYVMLDCGLRAEEIANLKYSDINFSKGYIKVFGKGQKERIVPIGHKSRKAIMDYIYKRRLSDSSDATNLFLTNKRQPLTTESVTRLFRRLKVRSGVVRVHAHLLRHTFATNFLLNGFGDVYQLSQLLGHADLKITEKYLHVASYYEIIENQRKKSLSYFDSCYK